MGPTTEKSPPGIPDGLVVINATTVGNCYNASLEEITKRVVSARSVASGVVRDRAHGHFASGALGTKVSNGL